MREVKRGDVQEINRGQPAQGLKDDVELKIGSIESFKHFNKGWYSLYIFKYAYKWTIYWRRAHENARRPVRGLLKLSVWVMMIIWIKAVVLEVVRGNLEIGWL